MAVRQSVRKESLRTTAATALAGSDVRMLENNIRSGLDALSREDQSCCLPDCNVFLLWSPRGRGEMIVIFCLHAI